MAGGRPTKLTEDIITKAREYDLEKNFPTVEDLALYLDISRSTLYKWKEENEEFSDIVEKLLTTQAKQLITKGLKNEYNASITKLMLSGKHGYVEKSEQDITTKGESIKTNVPQELVKDFTTYLKDKTKE